jgi:hypothetical protein
MLLRLRGAPEDQTCQLLLFSIRNGLAAASSPNHRVHLFLDTEHKVKATFQPPFHVTCANTIWQGDMHALLKKAIAGVLVKS